MMVHSPLPMGCSRSRRRSRAGFHCGSDCQYFKRVRFGEHFLDTSQFMQNLWRIKALKFQCVYA